MFINFSGLAVSMDGLNEEEDSYLEFELPSVIKLRTKIEPSYISESHNLYVQACHSLTFTEGFEEEQESIKKYDILLEPTQLYAEKDISSQVSSIALIYDGIFSLTDNQIRTGTSFDSYDIKLPRDNIFYHHKFSYQKPDGNNHSSSSSKTQHPQQIVGYVNSENGCGCSAYSYGGRFIAGQSLSSCEQVYYTVKFVPSGYIQHITRERFQIFKNSKSHISRVFPHSTQILLFSHTDWVNRGVSPFSSARQNAGDIGDDKDVHVTFSPAAFPKWGTPVASRILEGCAVFNLVYKADTYLVSQTYKSFEFQDRGGSRLNSYADIFFMPIDEAPDVFPLNAPESLLNAAHEVKVFSNLSNISEKLEAIRRIFSYKKQTYPLILSEASLSKEGLAKTLEPCIDAFIEGHEKFKNFTRKHPSLAPFFLDSLHDLLGGEVRFCACALKETFTSEKVRIEEGLVKFVENNLHVSHQNAESTVQALDFVMKIVLDRSPLDKKSIKSSPFAPTAPPKVCQAVLNKNKPSLTTPKIHKNKKEYIGTTHIYRIKKNGKTYKIGQSAQGTRMKDGASKRAEQQARKLNRENPDDIYETEIRKTFNSKEEALAYEATLIKRFKRIFGEDALPGNKVDR